MRRGGIVADLGPGGRAGLLALTLLAGARAAGLILIAQAIADAVAGLAAGHGVGNGALAVGVAGVLLRAVASWGTTTLAARMAAAAKRDWRERLTRRVAATGTDAGAEETLLATRGLDDLDGYLGTVLPAMVGAVVIPLALGTRILIADPLSALIVAVTLPLIPVFMILIGMHSRERAEATAGALTRLGEHLVELAEGLPVLVGLGRAREQTAALAVIQDDYRSRVDRAARTALLSALALELIATLSVAVVAVTLGVRLLSGSVALDVALVVLLLAPDCFSALRDIGAAYHQAQDGRSALTRVRALLERQVRSLRRDTGRASLDALRIRHPGRTTIGPVTADLPATGMVAVRGPSGAGKSTLLDAIAGVADPDAEVSGRIVGLPLDELAVARQAPRFFASTPLDELGLVGPEHAGILAELGLEEHGRDPIARLSPGEQRRVAVARALARVDAGARILILDEPTAHLDDASALLTRAAIRRRQDRVLVIVASHDPAVIDGADTIIDLPEPAQEARPQRLAALGSPSSSAAPGQLPERPRRRSGRGVWVGAIALGVVASGMSLALTGVSGWLIVRAAAEPAIMYLLVAIVGVRFFGLGRAVARYAERIVSHRAALQMVDEIRLRVWRVLADRGTAARAARDAGTALDVLVNLPAQLRDLLPRVVTPLASGVLVGMGASVVIVVVAPGAAGIAVLLAATTALAPIAAWLADRRRQVRSVSTGSAMIRRFGALAASAADLRADGIAPAAVDRIDAIGRTLERQERSQSVVTASAGILAVVGTGAAAVLAPLFVGAPEIAAVVALLCLACLEPIAAAATGAQRIPALVAVARRLTAATTAPARAGGRRTAAVGPVERLTVDDLALAWEPGHPVFDHLDARIDADAWTVVDGPSGSGKTTLVAALLGDLDPAAGSIDVDGTDLALIQRDRWSTRISWCPQEAHVFDSTLRANLLLARPRTDPVTDDEAIAALEAVGLSRFAGPTGAGLGVRVGPRGSFLSGGERQRVAVARALLRRGDVVVLDEPTAHLDAPTAELMMDDVRRATAGRIVILVSHRDADRRPEDRIIRLGRSLAAVG